MASYIHDISDRRRPVAAERRSLTVQFAPRSASARQPPRSPPGSTSSSERASSPAPHRGSASRPRGSSPTTAPRSRSPSATSPPASRSRLHPPSTGNGRVDVRRWSSRTGVGRRVRRRSGTGRSTSCQQRRRDGHPGAHAHAARRRASLRDQPSRPFPARDRLARALARPAARAWCRCRPAHLYCPVLFDDRFAFVPYTPFVGYGQSKTANVLFAVGADRRWERDGITVNAVMPGGIATGSSATSIPRRSSGRDARPGERRAQDRRAGRRHVDPRRRSRRCSTASAAATSRTARGPDRQLRADSDGRHGVAPYALDPANAERLWEMFRAARVFARRQLAAGQLLELLEGFGLQELAACAGACSAGFGADRAMTVMGACARIPRRSPSTP